MTFLIDECLHTSLAAVAHDKSHDGFHIIGLARATKRIGILMARIVENDYTFVTNNAGFPKDLRQAIAPCRIGPSSYLKSSKPLQRELFELNLQEIAGGGEFLNEVSETSIEHDAAVLTRSSFPAI